MQIQLDLLGGLAGDMFIASVLDAFPEHAEGVLHAAAALAPLFGREADGVRLLPHSDGVFRGRRFIVDDETRGGETLRRLGFDGDHSRAHDRSHGHDHSNGHGHPHSHEHPHPHSHEHEHEHEHEHPHSHDHPHRHDPPSSSGSPEDPVRWSDIRTRLQAALSPGVLCHALGIFGVLAEAEAQVHGVAVDAVEFHEVGAWDSVVDIVGAAWLIDVLAASAWHVGAVPLGFGRVRTAHGPMPVPTPATALLLRGFTTLDDGIGGERVTPTGAAILKYLVPEGNAAAGRPAAPRVLRRSGVGFGSRRLEGISNCVRLLAFDDAPAAAPLPAHRELAVVEFEVDDQSAEELAIGLDRLRAHADIFDVVQAPVFGKKGRMMTAVRLLASPAALDAVLDACFRETTTIGLRHTTVRGRALPRHFDVVDVDGHKVRVKSVERPGGATAKAESDDALAHETHGARRQIRQKAERQVLDAARKKADA